MSGNRAEAAKTYALLIGIDRYQPNLLPDGTYFKNLKGCVRDINNVERYLREELELPPEQIVKLTISDDADQTAEDPARWPTKQNIIAAFERLREQCVPGDCVYVHYSGHGGRVRTPERYRHLKGGDGFDEALVPTDISNSEDNYLRDFEVATLIRSLVQKGLRVTVVFDSCHSGGATRSGAPPEASPKSAVRSIGLVDLDLPPTRFAVATDEELEAAWLSSQAPGGARSLATDAAWLPEPKGYVFLSACRASEYAWEHEFTEEGKSGALTHWQLDTLRQLGPGASSKAVYDRVMSLVHSQFPTQTPQLQGERDRSLFGGEAAAMWDAATVLKVESDGTEVWLGVGSAQGVREGARFDIYRNRRDGRRDEDDHLATVEVTTVEHVKSCARVVAYAPGKPSVEPGDQAVLSEVEGVQKRRAVRIVGRNGGAVGAQEGVALEEVARLLKQGSSLLRTAREQETPSFVVTINADAQLVVAGPSGEALPHQYPPLAVSDPNAPHRAAERLAHLAKFHNVLDLKNGETISPLAGKLLLEVLGWQTHYTPGDPPEMEPFGAGSAAPTLRIGDWVFLRITNKHREVLNVTGLALQADWSIGQIFPSGAAMFEPLEPEQSVQLSLRANLPEGFDEGVDIIKVFATVGPSNFRILELAPLGVHGPTRPALRGSQPNELEALFLTLLGESPGQRTLTRGIAACDEWTVTQERVVVRRH